MRAWTGGADPRSCASFPLVPFSGRIDRGRFSHEGRSYQLPINMAPHAIHGDGWQAAWSVLAAGDSEAALRLERDGPVFRYEAEQRFSLHDDRLEVRLEVLNRADVAMPFGLGLHPYFDRRAEALISAEVTGVWMPDETNIPRELVPVPTEWGFRLRRPVAELTLDHNFQGWSGQARIDWPAARRSLVIEASDAFRHLVVFVPPAEPYFCVEPVSHVANGVNLRTHAGAESGVRVLEPGARLGGTVVFRPIAS